MQFKPLANTEQMLSAIGQGTGIGGHLVRFTKYGDEHVKALIFGIELGMTFIDTAAEYGNGRAEEIVAQAVKGRRDKVFIATKFSPQNNAYKEVIKAAEDSLRRLNTDYIDLYQAHWPNPAIPIQETMNALAQLVKQGKVRYIGLCNFSLAEFKEAQAALSKMKIVSIQVEYNLFDRSIEKDILQYCQQQNITTIAYSPLNQGAMAFGVKKMSVLKGIADKYGKTIAQIILNWLVAHKNVVAIPQSTNQKHLAENAGAGDFMLEEEDYRSINETFSSQCSYIPTDEIRVFNSENSKTYKSMEEAIKNDLGFIPTPLALSKTIQATGQIKPIRVIPCKGRDEKYKFDLTEGRIRYWAWVIAHKGKVPIPAYIREDRVT